MFTVLNNCIILVSKEMCENRKICHRLCIGNEVLDCFIYLCALELKNNLNKSKFNFSGVTIQAV